MFRTRKIRARAKEEGKTFDDVAKECEERGEDFKFSERVVKIPGLRRKKEVMDVECDDVEVGKGA